VRKRWSVAIAGAVALIVAAVWMAGTGNVPWRGSGTAEAGTARVGPGGGTFTFPGGVTVTVPKGAVERETTLRATAPQALKAAETGPLTGVRTAAVKLDISLSGGVQPKVPLTVKVPDRDAGIALPYTPDGSTYALLQSVREGQATKISLPHLSPKYVAYVSDQALLDSFFPQKVEKNRDACKQEVTVSGQKIRIGGASRGWSLKDGSPIFACLSPGSDGYVRVGIANRVDYILSVAATSNVRLATSRGDSEEEVVKYVSKLLPFGGKVKAYLGRDGKLAGSIDAKDLPATIELQGDFRTFAAESIVRLFGLTVGLLTGEGNAGKTMETVGTLLEQGSLVSCVRNSMDPLSGNATLGQAVNAGAGCFGTLVGLLAGRMNLAKALWRLAWVGDALKAIVDTVTSSISGIRMQLRNTLRVEVAGSSGAAAGQAFTLKPNFANFEAGESISMFDRLTIPHPSNWTGAMSEPDVVLNFAEDCGGTTADCPHVNFVDLASSKASGYFGSDPVKHWAAQSCSGGTPAKVEGPVQLTLGGQPAQLYRQRCGADRYASPRYAWMVPGKRLFVMITDVGASPEIVEGALERVRWH
jgi:hypothetical protein